jgi:transcription initiation factor IIF auxiliary subunit
MNEQERIQELEAQLQKVTDERDSYKAQYEYLRKKWHPSPGRKPVYTDGYAAGLYINHYYDVVSIRQLAKDNGIAVSTVQRLIKKQAQEMADDVSSGRLQLSKDSTRHNVELGILQDVLKNKWYTSEFQRLNIVALLGREGIPC